MKKLLLLALLAATTLIPADPVASQIMILAHVDGAHLRYQAIVNKTPATFEELKKQYPELVQVINVCISDK